MNSSRELSNAVALSKRSHWLYLLLSNELNFYLYVVINSNPSKHLKQKTKKKKMNKETEVQVRTGCSDTRSTFLESLRAKLKTSV